MSKTDAIEVEGTVLEKLPNAMFTGRSDNPSSAEARRARLRNRSRIRGTVTRIRGIERFSQGSSS